MNTNYGQHRFPKDTWIKESFEWYVIQQHYGDQKTKRSQVPLINHIKEGIQILIDLKASTNAIRAFMVHPIFQTDRDLHLYHGMLTGGGFSREVTFLILEYRRAANAYLCKPHTDTWTIEIIREQVGSLEYNLPLQQMLIADKWQNQKDFYQYHALTHPRAAYLANYFDNWRDFLDPDNHIWKSLSNNFGLLYSA